MKKPPDPLQLTSHHSCSILISCFAHAWASVPYLSNSSLSYLPIDACRLTDRLFLCNLVLCSLFSLHQIQFAEFSRGAPGAVLQFYFSSALIGPVVGLFPLLRQWVRGMTSLLFSGKVYQPSSSHPYRHRVGGAEGLLDLFQIVLSDVVLLFLALSYFISRMISGAAIETIPQCSSNFLSLTMQGYVGYCGLCAIGVSSHLSLIDDSWFVCAILFRVQTRLLIVVLWANAGRLMAKLNWIRNILLLFSHVSATTKYLLSNSSWFSPYAFRWWTTYGAQFSPNYGMLMLQFYDAGSWLVKWQLHWPFYAGYVLFLLKCFLWDSLLLLCILVRGRLRLRVFPRPLSSPIHGSAKLLYISYYSTIFLCGCIVHI